jgi:hypothetical protein
MSENQKVWLPPGVYSHWCHLFPNISSPPSEFYGLLEKALDERKIPKTAISRVYHKEGSLLSAKREYLRMNFDRLVFDVCGAPFGIPSEAPKPTVKTSPMTADMGRGGAQHQSIQKRLKTVAEELGFRATIEKEVLDGEGSVDLALEKEGCAIACEITVTTTIDHEFGNIQKCLKAGFPMVAVVSPKAERLSQIEEAVKAGLGRDQSELVRYFLPEEFITWLRDLAQTIPAPPASPPVPSERITRGYKVRRSAAKLTEEERKAKEEIVLKAIAESMKKPRK